MKRVAIVIVTYNSAAEIPACLDALRALEHVEVSSKVVVEVIVVDNASTDATRDEVMKRGVALLANPTNAGFAAAVNAGVRATTAPLVLLLNPDAILQRGLEALIACFDDPNAGAAGGLLVDPSGCPQAGFMARNLPTAGVLILEVLGINRVWPRNSLNWHYRCKGLDPMQAALVDQPAGAFLMFPRAVWEKLGGFDERFWPIWFEDVDFCARIKAANLKIFYEPKAVATHKGGHSIAPLPAAARETYWYGSLLEYSAKHYRPNTFRAICLAVLVGVGGRALRGFTYGGAKASGVYGRVAGNAISWFFRTRAQNGSGVGVG